MKKCLIAGTSLILAFAFCFISIGYAQLTDTLTITGKAEIQEIQAVYITEVKVYDSNRTTGESPSVTQTGLLTFQHNDYSLNGQWYDTGGSVTIEVTVKNNSGVDQYFVYHTAVTESDVEKLADNAVVSYTLATKDRLVPQGEKRTFLFTIQNTKSNALSMNGFESLLVFSPNFDDDATESATYSLAKIFANVLAGKGPAGDSVGIQYEGREVAAADILQQILNKMTDVETGGYTGNVGNATQSEKDLMEAIFGDNIVIQLGNNYYSVYLLIKNQQINNEGDNDMVIYVTADQLNVGSGEWRNNAWQDLNIVPVYGLVFIKEGNTYKYCNHLFAGEAPVCDFGGALGEGKIGNFHTNIWNSTEFSVSDTSGGSIGQQYITTNGELDEAYRHFIQQNPNALIELDQVK